MTVDRCTRQANGCDWLVLVNHRSMILLLYFNQWFDVVCCRHTPDISELATTVYDLLFCHNSASTDQVPVNENGSKNRYNFTNAYRSVVSFAKLTTSPRHLFDVQLLFLVGFPRLELWHYLSAFPKPILQS